MNKSGINGILAVMSVLVLLIPIGVSGYVQEKTISNIINVQGNYSDGETFGLYNGDNITEIFTDLNTPSDVDNVIGWDANNDTVYQGYKSTGISTERDATYYGNYVTYTGSGNHTMIVDWDDIDDTIYDSVKYLYIPLNITNSELAEYDFLKIHTTFDVSNGANIRFYYASNNNVTMIDIYPVVIDSDTWILIISYDIKQALEQNPYGTVWFGYWGSESQLNKTQTSFTWKIEGYELAESDYIFGSEFTDFTVWIIMVLGMDAFYLFVVIFANPVIDIKIDNSGKKGKWRR